MTLAENLQAYQAASHYLNRAIGASELAEYYTDFPMDTMRHILLAAFYYQLAKADYSKIENSADKIDEIDTKLAELEQQLLVLFGYSGLKAIITSQSEPDKKALLALRACAKSLLLAELITLKQLYCTSSQSEQLFRGTLM